jgi:tetratricopeptide (TPR) repeat protein
VMKFSRTALAAVLIAGTSGFAMTAPAAAKKKEEAKGGLVVSEPIRVAATATTAALTAKDFATAETNVALIESTAKTEDERYIAQAYRLQLEANKLGDKGNPAVLAGPLDALIANPKTPPAEVGRYAYMRANIAYNAKQYPQALAGYQRAVAAGFTAPNMQLQIARVKIQSGDIAGGVADIEKQVAADKAAGRPVDEDLYKYAIVALQKTPDTAGTMRWTRDWLYSYNTAQNWHTAIYVFGFQGENDKKITKRERIDLFRLLRATKSLAGEREYIEYADLAVQTANAAEAKSVIGEGNANGKLAAGNSAAKLTLGEANTQLASEGSLATQEKRALASADGLEANGVGDYALGTGNAAKAIEMYKLALSKGSAKLNKDEVNTHLGIAYLQAGDKASAKAAFAQVTTGLRGQIAALWSVWADAPGTPTA